jgi:hypothetical protein
LKINNDKISQHPKDLWLFFANRTLALKETPNSTKHPKKNENYNEILEKPFIVNLQTVSTARRRCRSSLSRPDVVGCRQEVVEQVKKTTSVPKTKKKEELPMKLDVFFLSILCFCVYFTCFCLYVLDVYWCISHGFYVYLPCFCV